MEISANNSDKLDVLSAVAAIKNAILISRYNAARLVNREQLELYYNIGQFISKNSRSGFWGTGAIAKISSMLKQELPGLKGFSEAGLKRMRTFYEGWSKYISNRPTPLDDLNNTLIFDTACVINRPIALDDFSDKESEWFLSIGFSHHYEILIKSSSLQERLYYIKRCATEFWSVAKLRYMLEVNAYASDKIQNTNFTATIPSLDLRAKALQSFKDEYLLDFINVEDPADFDERVLENQIVQNIKNFIMAFGQDFAFMGNQYRLEVDGDELFIDLLFYHRGLKCLVAVELKSGKFKGAFAGQLNTYLSALDDLVRKPDENPSIGIILCKEKSDKMVEYAFRDTSKPMGVATYRLTNELPQKYTEALPNPDELRKLL